MLPLLNRLPYHVYRANKLSFKRTTTSSLEIKVKPGTTNSRFLFIVPKTKVRLGSHRQRTKRLLSQAVYELIRQIKNSVDVVVKANTDFSKTALSEVKNTIKQLFIKANII